MQLAKRALSSQRIRGLRVTDLHALAEDEMHIAGRWQRSVLRRAALRYAGRGWRVIPGAALMNDRYVCGPLCPTIAIHPALDRWQAAASSVSSDVDGWWRKTPHS